MAERVMLGLGEFRFEIATLAYQKFSLNQSWRWPEQARINRDTALQFVGRNIGEIELDGVIYPSFKGGLGLIEAMRSLADAGKPLQLVDGLGRIWGAWVITEIGDTRTVFADDGQPRKLEFRIKLKAYGEDDLAQAGIKPLVSGGVKPSASTSDTALTKANARLGDLTRAAEALPDLTSVTPPSALASAVATTRGLVGEVIQTVAGVARDLSGAVSAAMGELRQGVLDAIPAQALQAARDVQGTVGELMALHRDLQSTVVSVKSVPQTLKRDIARMDGQLRLATYSSAAASRILRDAEKTLVTVAGMTDRRGQSLQQSAAHAAATAARSAEQLQALCDIAQQCSGRIVQKWEQWHA